MTDIAIKKIVFASHDPGGFNLLVPVIRSYAADPGFEVHLLLAGAALKRFADLGVSAATLHHVASFSCKDYPCEFDVNPAEIESVLAGITPDAIVTGTSINSNIERYSIQYGNANGTPTFSFIDSWVGENVRFRSAQLEVYPQNILVCDHAMADLYIGFASPDCRISVVGNPHLENLYNELHAITGESEYTGDRILFFSENMFHYWPDGKLNEMQIVDQILSSCQPARQIRIAIRPHPLESREHWVRFLDERKDRNPMIHLELDPIKDVRSSIRASLLTFGVSSMALIESSIMGKYTFSYQVGIAGDKEMLYIPFSEYGIAEKQDIADVCRVFDDPPAAAQHARFSFENSLNKVRAHIGAELMAHSQ
ncbi:MAG: hypothetical protein JO301_10035 [Chitinophagaceae bacterium]|nr:hypothetical protein [Chitinophagaceae bacterium]